MTTAKESGNLEANGYSVGLSHRRRVHHDGVQDELLTIGRLARAVGPTEAPQEALMTRLIIPVQESTA